jgi:hypothetical protein
MSDPTAKEIALPLSGGLAAFLIRVAAYFQGYLSAFPSLPQMPLHGAHGGIPLEGYNAEGPLTLMDGSVAETSGPLTRVRMNRALRRRMRWLVRRGRIKGSGQHRIASPQIEARCTLSPGQMNEYCIRRYRLSRVVTYGLGMSCRLLRLRALLSTDMQGNAMCLRQVMSCAAPLSPD